MRFFRHVYDETITGLLVQGDGLKVAMGHHREDAGLQHQPFTDRLAESHPK